MALRDRVRPTEHLARYLTHSNHFNRSRHSVKHHAFQPPSSLRLSVFRIQGLEPDQAWAIGETHVVAATSMRLSTLYGMADILASAIQEQKLDVDADDIPSRHADDVGWPEDKSERKLIAMELAAEAALVFRC